MEGAADGQEATSVTRRPLRRLRGPLPGPVARVASILLFWSQLAQHHFRGRLGIYKTDADIAAEIRKHPKTAGRLVVKVCALPGTTFASDLFVMAYGPKPRAHSGRVRWLFRTALGDQLINKALELAGARRQRKHPAAIGGNKSVSPVTAKCSYRSPQNAATPYLHKDDADLRSQEHLSLAELQKEKPDLTKEKRLQEELKKLEALWNRACTECGQVTLVWPPSEVRRWSAKLIELIEVLRLGELSDDELLKRLRLLTGDMENFLLVYGPSLTASNRPGLINESFARFGQKLWRAAEAELGE